MKNKESYPVGYTIKRMLSFAYEKNKKLFYVFCIYTVTAAIYPFFAIILPKLLIGEVMKVDGGSLSGILSIVISFFIATAIFGFIKTFLSNFAYPAITKLRIDYIRDTFEKIVTIDYKYMEDAKFLEKNDRAISSTSGDDNGVEGVYHKLFVIAANLLTILGLAVFIGRLSIWILLGLTSNIIIGYCVKRWVHQYTYKKKEAISHLERKKKYYYNTTHDFSYGKDIRLFQFKEKILANYGNEVKDYIKIHKNIKNYEFRLGFMELLTLVLSNILTYLILVYKVLNGMPIADFSMYIIAVTALTQFLSTAADQITFIINEGQYVYDYFQFIDGDLGERGGKRKAIQKDTLEIVFDKVSFRYPGTDQYIIKDLDFTIHKGDKLAIVGINGAGKSTLVKLMTGLFTVTEGEIRINDIPIDEFDKKELFSMFSVVFQDVNILAFTIMENIVCSSDKENHSFAEKALDKVGLLQKVKSTPKGLNQMMLKIIEEDGVEFSGGESQKLVIARALYKNGNMVIMDEPTAALDAMAEADIYENFSELVEGKTAVYISHRLASTKFCDKIALFDKNGLKEYGNHEELMKLKGAYYNMFTVQGKYYKEGEICDEAI